MNAPNHDRILALANELLHEIETRQANPAEGYCAAWCAFVRMTQLVFGTELATKIRDEIRAAAQGNAGLGFLSSLPPAGEA